MVLLPTSIIDYIRELASQMMYADTLIDLAMVGPPQENIWTQSGYLLTINDREVVMFIQEWRYVWPHLLNDRVPCYVYHEFKPLLALQESLELEHLLEDDMDDEAAQIWHDNYMQ